MHFYFFNVLAGNMNVHDSLLLSYVWNTLVVTLYDMESGLEKSRIDMKYRK